MNKTASKSARKCGRTSASLPGPKHAFLVLGLVLISGLAAAQAPGLVWEIKKGFNLAPPPALADLNLDGDMEVILVGEDDRVSIVEPKTQSALWEVTISVEGSLQPPAWGHFMGDGTIDVALTSSDGLLLILDGATGDALAQHSLGFEPQRCPVTFPLPEDGTFRDGIAVVNSKGEVTGFSFAPGESPKSLFTWKIGGMSKSPVIIGNTGLDAPGAHMITVSRDGLISVYPPSKPEAKVTRRIAGTKKQEIWASSGDVNGDGKDDIVVADHAGYLHAYTVSADAIEPIWEGVSILSRPSYHPCVIDISGDGKDDVLICKEKKQLFIIDGATGVKGSYWEKGTYFHTAKINAQPSVFFDGLGHAVAALSDDKNRLAIYDLTDRKYATAGATELVWEVAESQISPLVAPIVDPQTLEVLTLGWSDGVGYLYELGLNASSSKPGWVAYNGNPWRTSGASMSYHAYQGDQAAHLKQLFEQNLATAQSEADAGNWDESLAAANAALAASPSDERAQALYRAASTRKNIIWIVLGTIVALAVLGLIGFVAGRSLSRKNRLNKARKAVAANDSMAAAKHMRVLYDAQPDNKTHLQTLADLYVAAEKYDAESVDVFEKAHQTFPQEERFTRGLAMAYQHMGRKDSEAASVYSDMVSIVSTPGPWAFALGEVYLSQGNDREALELFLQALNSGFDTPRLHENLADLYVKNNVVRPRILPTMAKVFDKRKNDKAFLTTYCAAYGVSRQYDDQARRVAQALLALDPQAPQALMIEASMLLRAGEHKESMKHAEAILKQSPNDSAGLRLLGAAYAAEGRLDETAMKIFNQALSANPEARDILLAVSKGYIQQGRTDPQAEQVYRRALQGNPEDETLVRFMAEFAGSKSDDDLTIELCERLLKMGPQDERKFVLQLANAYCRKGVLKPEAEPVYRDALQFQPDHATVALHLATMYQQQGRTDSDAVRVYELVFEKDPTRRDIGRQLALAYDAEELSDQALKLTQKLLSDQPDDAEMKKINANAAAALDQMDSAIQSYEQVLAAQPDDSETIVRLARLYARKRRTDSAATKLYQRAIRAKTDDLEAHHALSRSWAVAGNFDQAIATVRHMLTNNPSANDSAIEILEEIIEMAPSQVSPRWFLVEILTYAGRLREACEQLMEISYLDDSQAEEVMKAYDKVLDQNPKEATAHHQKGLILKKLGRYPEARLSLELAVRHRPTDDKLARELLELYQLMLDRAESVEVRYQLGQLALKTGKHDLAISCFQKTDKDYRWEQPSIKNLARCYIAKGLLDLAFQEARRLAVDDETKEILYELGRRYEAVNDIKGAREVYQSIFAIDIGYQDVKGKLEMLEASQGGPLQADRTAVIGGGDSSSANLRYDLVEELGRGAMGIVYKAVDTELDEEVALKILPDTLVNNPEALSRFRREARNARQLSHPNIVRIHDIGEEGGRKFISMEFVDGIDLKERLTEMDRKLAFPETLDYARQICQAMAAAHDAGIVHRDMKPANVMITRDNKVKIADFGIAKAVEQSEKATAADATRAGAVVGTPLYMSPEQVQGKPVDYRADIYSLGIMFYELLTGLPPFVEGDLSFHHCFTEPARPEKGNETFINIILKCLAKDPDDRWQNVREIITELGKIQ